MNPKISVIVPVYNAESTVENCVNSILKQTFSDIEILLINDGSSDNSLEVINKIAKKDNRISVFTKKNGGQSSARNMGLDNVQGDYVAFIDSDDTIEKDMLSMLYNNAIAEDAQMSICGVRILKNGLDITPLKHSTDKIVFSRKEAIEQLLAEKYILFSVCDKLYKRSLFDNIRFPVGVIHEDVLLPYKLTMLCDKVVCEMKPKYNYLLNDESTTGKPFSEARMNDIYAREEIVEDIKKVYPDLYINSMNIKLVGYLNIINKLVNEENISAQKYLPPLIKRVRKDKRLYLKNPYINIKKKIGVILISSGKIFYKIAYNFINKGIL